MENKQPLVSVIMNCYNSDKYLKDAINSVLSQTYQNWEIIFWDNQSTDKSAEIVKSYNDERIKYFYAPKHTMLGEARNLAVKQANGDWIGFLDCDDIWYNNKLEVQFQNLPDDIGMIYSRMEFLLENSGLKTDMAKSISKNIYPKRKHLPSGDIFDKLLFECFIPLPSVLIKKDLFNQVGGINGSLKVAEDYDIFLKVANVSKVKVVDNVLCKYRVHENNLSHSNMEKTFEESISLIQNYLPDLMAFKAVNYWNFIFKVNLFKNSKKSFFEFFHIQDLKSIIFNLYMYVKNR